MEDQHLDNQTLDFMKSLGFPELRVHHAFNHFDFKRPNRRILVIGPMGSGKTEYSSRVWRDGMVARKKSAAAARVTTTGEADRRNVFFIRSRLDAERFPDYPADSLAYRGGYNRCGENIAQISNSFDFEQIYREHPEIGTWIIDEASFYDERLIYLVRNESQQRGLVFIFPTLILNFRKDIFNSTARIMLETATDVFPLTAYCEHADCLEDAFYTYRYYLVDGKECPALYFDPLIIVGGDTEKHDPKKPNYCTRCDLHHYLPGKEYTFLVLNPLGTEAAQGNTGPLLEELGNLKTNIEKSLLYKNLEEMTTQKNQDGTIMMNSLRVSCIAEKALIYLYAEQNMLTSYQLKQFVEDLELDRRYMQKTLADNRRTIDL
jgi:thymidine kinase